MFDLIKGWDLNGKPVTFYYKTSTVHKTVFGGLLSVTSFTLMFTIAITTLVNFFLQKPIINSNIVFYINKKFAYLEYFDIKGKLRIDNNEDFTQLNEFGKYFRVAFYEKNEYDYLDNLRVAKFIKGINNNMQFDFRFKIPISDVFKEKEFSVLKIMSCKELKKYEFTIWEDEDDKKNCQDEYENYFYKNYPKNDFTFLFNTPIYSVDRSGRLQKTNHENEFSFAIEKNEYSSYSMETKFVIVEDDSNLYVNQKNYEAYVVLKNPSLTIKKQYFKGYSLEINLENKNSEQIILITIQKYKLLECLAKLGGIMKIITLMKMSCKFWTSYLYETTLYNLIVTRKNKYLDEKKAIIESSYSLSQSNNNNNNQINDTSKLKIKKNFHKERYTSYCIWFANRFCRCWYHNKEAKQKRNMLCEILGLKNYLLHLDYIDRQIMLEQQNTKINFVINDINSNYSSQTSSPRRTEGKNLHIENKSMELSSSFGNENEEKKFKI